MVKSQLNREFTRRREARKAAAIQKRHLSGHEVSLESVPGLPQLIVYTTSLEYGNKAYWNWLHSGFCVLSQGNELMAIWTSLLSQDSYMKQYSSCIHCLCSCPPFEHNHNKAIAQQHWLFLIRFNLFKAHCPTLGPTPSTSSKVFYSLYGLEEGVASLKAIIFLYLTVQLLYWTMACGVVVWKEVHAYWAHSLIIYIIFTCIHIMNFGSHLTIEQIKGTVPQGISPSLLHSVLPCRDKH